MSFPKRFSETVRLHTAPAFPWAKPLMVTKPRITAVALHGFVLTDPESKKILQHALIVRDMSVNNLIDSAADDLS